MKIRYAPGVAAAMSLFGSGLAMEEALGVERAMARAAVMAPPGAMSHISAEAAHRRELGMTERAAWESVGDDLQTGRWLA